MRADTQVLAFYRNENAAPLASVIFIAGLVCLGIPFASGGFADFFSQTPLRATCWLVVGVPCSLGALYVGGAWLRILFFLSGRAVIVTETDVVLTGPIGVAIRKSDVSDVYIRDGKAGPTLFVVGPAKKITIATSLIRGPEAACNAIRAATLGRPGLERETSP